MKFPALDLEEKGFFAAAVDTPEILTTLAERVRGGMIACLGIPVHVSCARMMLPFGQSAGKAPTMAANREAVNVWLSARFGGAPETDWQASSALSGSLIRVLKRALAESVINLGNDVVWPEAVRLALCVQAQTGVVDIFLCAPQHLMHWARTELERTR